MLKDDRWDDAGFEDFGHIHLQPMTSPSKVQLKQVAGVSPKWSETKIVHRNGVRCMTVTAELPRTMTAENFAPDLQRFVEEEMRLPQGVTTELGGEIENDKESMPQLGAGLFIAMIIIFFFLLFNFKKYKLTFVCMFAVILFIPSAMFGLFITDTTMGLTTIFGFITLMGLIMRNEILIFEHAEGGMKNGLSAREAAFEAGKRRMVPIFLTTVTTAVGVVPMIAAGSAMWKPVGITILLAAWVRSCWSSPCYRSFIGKLTKKEDENEILIETLVNTAIVAPHNSSSTAIHIRPMPRTGTEAKPYPTVSPSRYVESRRRQTQSLYSLFP